MCCPAWFGAFVALLANLTIASSAVALDDILPFHGAGIATVVIVYGATVGMSALLVWECMCCGVFCDSRMMRWMKMVLFVFGLFKVILGAIAIVVVSARELDDSWIERTLASGVVVPRTVLIAAIPVSGILDLMAVGLPDLPKSQRTYARGFSEP